LSGPLGWVLCALPELLQHSLLDRIADKWAVLILGLLKDGPVRFNRLRRDIEGISQKMLSQTLKNLERMVWCSGRRTRLCR
jgi:DNA-binding HxlR family transcriptional regulator